jgi:chemotaxis protein MotA
MQIFAWIDLGALSLTLGGTILVSFWIFRLKQWNLIGKVILDFSVKSRSLTPKVIATETLKLANAFKNHTPEFNQLVRDCPVRLLRESVEMVKEGILDEASLLQIVQTRVSATFFKNRQVADKLRLLAPYPASVGVFGAVICCYFLVQKMIGQPVATEAPQLISFGISCLLYGTFITFLGLFPLSRALGEWAKEQRLNDTLILVGTKLLVQKANPILVAEELNSYLPEEDRMDWKTVVSKTSGVRS